MKFWLGVLFFLFVNTTNAAYPRAYLEARNLKFDLIKKTLTLPTTARIEYTSGTSCANPQLVLISEDCQHEQYFNLGFTHEMLTIDVEGEGAFAIINLITVSQEGYYAECFQTHKASELVIPAGEATNSEPTSSEAELKLQQALANMAALLEEEVQTREERIQAVIKSKECKEQALRQDMKRHYDRQIKERDEELSELKEDQSDDHKKMRRLEEEKDQALRAQRKAEQALKDERRKHQLKLNEYKQESLQVNQRLNDQRASLKKYYSEKEDAQAERLQKAVAREAELQHQLRQDQQLYQRRLTDQEENFQKRLAAEKAERRKLVKAERAGWMHEKTALLLEESRKQQALQQEQLWTQQQLMSHVNELSAKLLQASPVSEPPVEVKPEEDETLSNEVKNHAAPADKKKKRKRGARKKESTKALAVTGRINPSVSQGDSITPPVRLTITTPITPPPATVVDVDNDDAQVTLEASASKPPDYEALKKTIAVAIKSMSMLSEEEFVQLQHWVELFVQESAPHSPQFNSASLVLAQLLNQFFVYHTRNGATSNAVRVYKLYLQLLETNTSLYDRTPIAGELDAAFARGGKGGRLAETDTRAHALSLSLQAHGTRLNALLDKLRPTIVNNDYEATDLQRLLDELLYALMGRQFEVAWARLEELLKIADLEDGIGASLYDNPDLDSDSGYGNGDADIARAIFRDLIYIRRFSIELGGDYANGLVWSEVSAVRVKKLFEFLKRLLKKAHTHKEGFNYSEIVYCEAEKSGRIPVNIDSGSLSTSSSSSWGTMMSAITVRFAYQAKEARAKELYLHQSLAGTDSLLNQLKYIQKVKKGPTDKIMLDPEGRLDEMGLFIRATPKDGHCLFHAVLQGLAMFEGESGMTPVEFVQLLIIFALSDTAIVSDFTPLHQALQLAEGETHGLDKMVNMLLDAVQMTDANDQTGWGGSELLSLISRYLARPVMMIQATHTFSIAGHIAILFLPGAEPRMMKAEDVKVFMQTDIDVLLIGYIQGDPVTGTGNHWFQLSANPFTILNPGHEYQPVASDFSLESNNGGQVRTNHSQVELHRNIWSQGVENGGGDALLLDSFRQ